MSNYITGRRFEYRVKKKLEDEGYLVIRSAGSHSPFDLVAFNKDGTLLIQCKRNNSNLKKITEKLQEIKERFTNGNTKIFIATTQKRKLVFLEV